MARRRPPKRIEAIPGQMMIPVQPAYPAGTRRAGRPSSLTPEVQERFMAAIRGGNTMADAAAFCGLSERNVRYWAARGRGDHPTEPPWPEYVNFYRALEEARAAARVFAVSSLHSRSRTDTQAALAWLRRHGGPEWRDEEPPPPAPAQQVNVTVDAREQTGNFVVIPAESMPDFIRSLLEEKRAAQENSEPEDVVETVTDGRRPSRLRNQGLRVEAGEVVTS